MLLLPGITPNATLEEVVSFCFVFSLQYISNKEGAAKVSWPDHLNESLLLLFQTLHYLVRCLTAEIDLLSYLRSCFQLQKDMCKIEPCSH